MKTVVPNYYARFSCLMGACRHSCCIGWEIDIDADMLARYQRTDGAIGSRLRECIAVSDEGACFRLDAQERCPFLNKDGLCDLILELGEDCLCQICADHPRYRNFFSDREEIGLGLCCEAAGHLILTQQEPARFTIIDDDQETESLQEDEQILLQLRTEAIQIAQNRDCSIEQRLEQLAHWAALPYPISFDTDWKEFFVKLECLDVRWHSLLDTALFNHVTAAMDDRWEIAHEHLLVYLLQRHIPGALEDDDFSGRIAFVLLVMDLLRRLSLNAQSIDDLVEFARMYSSEIEYSDENIEAILVQLHKAYPEI